MVHHDSDTTGLLLSNSSFLELSKGESTALTDLAVVANGLGTDGGAEEGERADTESSSLGLAGCASAELASWLVKPCANTALPVLPEVVGGEDCETRDGLGPRDFRETQDPHRCCGRNPCLNLRIQTAKGQSSCILHDFGSVDAVPCVLKSSGRPMPIIHQYSAQCRRWLDRTR